MQIFQLNNWIWKNFKNVHKMVQSVWLDCLLHAFYPWHGIGWDWRTTMKRRKWQNQTNSIRKWILHQKKCLSFYRFFNSDFSIKFSIFLRYFSLEGLLLANFCLQRSNRVELRILGQLNHQYLDAGSTNR